MRLSLKPPAWMMALASRYVPFADAVSHDLPLGRLLRLSLFQAAIGKVKPLEPPQRATWAQRWRFCWWGPVYK